MCECGQEHCGICRDKPNSESRQVLREAPGYVRGGYAPGAELPTTIEFCGFFEEKLVGDRFRILGHDFFKTHGSSAKMRNGQKYLYCYDNKTLTMESI